MRIDEDDVESTVEFGSKANQNCVGTSVRCLRKLKDFAKIHENINFSGSGCKH